MTKKYRQDLKGQTKIDEGYGQTMTERTGKDRQGEKEIDRVTMRFSIRISILCFSMTFLIETIFQFDALKPQSFIEEKD